MPLVEDFQIIRMREREREREREYNSSSTYICMSYSKLLVFWFSWKQQRLKSMLKTCLPNFLNVGHCVTALVFTPSFQSMHNPSYTPSTHRSSWQPILPPIQNTDSCKRRRRNFFFLKKVCLLCMCIEGTMFNYY